MKPIFENKTKLPISEGLEYHLDTNIPLYENIYRFGSKSYFDLINEARDLYKRGLLEVNSSVDKWMLEKTNIGEMGIYNGKNVLLDIPMQLNEAEYQGRDVELNKPSRSSGPKKYQVYVKNDSGNVIKVNFGDAKGGLTAKINNPDARKAFADRHDCKNKKDKTKAGYWSCNLPRYWKALGGGEDMNTYW
jgi:hypothetical protein